MAIAMVFALIFAFAAIPASAATTYTPLGVSTSTANHSTTLKKYLVVDEDATIPNKTFDFFCCCGFSDCCNRLYSCGNFRSVVTDAQSAAVTAPLLLRLLLSRLPDTTYTDMHFGDTPVTGTPMSKIR